MSDLLQKYLAIVEASIDERGVYPHQCVYRDAEDKIVMAALDLTAPQVIEFVWRQITCEQARELIFCLDRTTRPNQGTEFADMLACGHWSPDFHESWNRAWRPFVIDYQHEPRVVRAPKFANAFWNEQILAELATRCPKYRVKVSRAAPTETRHR